MGIMTRFTLMHLKNNKKHAFFSSFAIFIATLFLSSLLFYVYSFNQSKIADWIRTEGDWHAEFYTTIPGDQISYIESNPQVEKVLAKTDFYIQKPMDVKGRPYFANINLDENYRQDMRMEGMVKEGRLAHTTSEIAISEDFFLDNPVYKLGDSIVLKEGKRILNEKEIDVLSREKEGEVFLPTEEEATYTIVGILDADQEYSDTPIYLSIGYNNEHLADKDYVVYMKAQNMRKIYEIMPWLSEKLGIEPDAKGNYPIKYNHYLLGSYGIFQDTVSMQFKNTMIMYTIIACILMSFFIVIIYHTFSVSAHARVKHLGLLKSIGATPKQIGESVLVEGLFLALIAMPFGISGGYVCIKLVFHYINKLYTAQGLCMWVKPYFSPLIVIAIIILTLVVVLLSVYFPARKVAKLSPIVAIKQGDYKMDKLKSTKFLQWVEKRGGYEVVLAFKSHCAQRKRFRTAYISLSLSFVIVVGTGVYLNVWDLSQKVDPKPITYEMKISLTDVGEKESHSLGEEVRAIEGVEKIQREKGRIDARIDVGVEDLSEEVKSRGLKYLEERNALVHGKYEMWVQIVTLDDISFEEYCEKIGAGQGSMNRINGLPAILYNNVLYSSEVLLERQENIPLFSWKKGDVLTLTEEIGREEKEGGPYAFDVELMHVTQEYVGHGRYYDDYQVVLIMPEVAVRGIEPYLSELNQKRFNREYTYLDMPREQIQQVREHVETIYDRHKDKANFRLWDYLTATEGQARSVQLLVSMVFVGIGFIALIGIVNIYSTISTQLLARKREFAMLKSIGISPKGLTQMLLIESVCYSIKPLLYGLPLIIGFGLYLLYMLRLSWRYIFTIFPYDYFIIAGIVLSGSVFCITYLLLRKIKQETIIEIIKEESY